MKLLLILIAILSNDALAEVPRGYEYERNVLVVSATAPPALFCLENHKGQRTGADFSLPVNENGTQKGEEGQGLSEIPLSRTDQDVETAFDGKEYEDFPWTVWSVSVHDGGAEVYTIDLRGIACDIETVYIAAVYRDKDRKTKSRKLNVLVQPGETKKIKFKFDPDAKKEDILLQGDNDLLQEIEAANRNHSIDGEQYQALMDKAKALEAEN